METQGSHDYGWISKTVQIIASDSRSVGEPAHPRREFGRRLRAARLALGYTQEQMAYEQFFAEQPRLLKRGTPQEVMVRSWAYGQGLSEAEIEVLVRARLNLPSTPISSSRLRVGSRDLHIAKTIDPEWRLVLINDLSKRRAEE